MKAADHPQFRISRRNRRAIIGIASLFLATSAGAEDAPLADVYPSHPQISNWTDMKAMDPLPNSSNTNGQNLGFPSRASLGAMDNTDGVQWERWEDPLERAFSLDIPAGWKITGGLMRRSPVDPRPFVQVRSPQDDAMVTSGDPRIPVHVLPGFSPFFPEGSDYLVGEKVRRFLPGNDFAREYVQTMLGPDLTNIRIVWSRDRADMVDGINALYAHFNVPTIQRRATMGEVRFTCYYHGKLLYGHWFAQTELTTQQAAGIQSGMWNVSFLLGCLAVPEKWSATVSIMCHMLQSTDVNPDWLNTQQANTAEFSRMTKQNNDLMSKIILKSANERLNLPDDDEETVSYRRKAANGDEDAKQWLTDHGKANNLNGWIP